MKCSRCGKKCDNGFFIDDGKVLCKECHAVRVLNPL